MIFLEKKLQHWLIKNWLREKYSVTFDASNVQSGVYFYRLQAENYTITKIMILLK
jgi:hypothetical protein